MPDVTAIAGMHPRSDWQDPAQPVTGPKPKGKAHTWVIHYPGGGSAPTGNAVAGYLRNIQADYVRSRGYSIGYSWGVAQDGSKWQIRGDDFNPASNPGRKVAGNFNDVSRSIFVMVTGHDEASPAAVRSVNEIISTHPDWTVITHGDVDYTTCCGAGLTRQVRNGTIGAWKPVPLEPQPPVPPTPIKDDDMSYLFKLPNGDYGLRGTAGSRRVSVEEFGQTVPPKETARAVTAGSNEAYWIGLELGAYDRNLIPPTS